MDVKPLTIGIVGADHMHIFGMLAGMRSAGAVCKGYWTERTPDVLDEAALNFGDIPRVEDRRRLLEDPAIDLILVAAIPADRARLSIEAMSYGKDVMCDKPGCIRLEDVAALRRTVEETGRIWSVNFSERYQVPGMLKAAEMVGEGAIGKVIQTVGLGPHRLNRHLRQPWFFDPRRQGGILVDIGAHQIDHFLAFTGSTEAEIVSSSVGNFTNTDLSEFTDWGEVLLRGKSATGYIRIDWLTPNSADNWGDSRFFIQGTEGTLEVRKYVDVGGRAGPDHLFWVRDGKSDHVDCGETRPRYFADLTFDVRNRTQPASTQHHSLTVTELAIRAQAIATRL
jgi:predicted dehydrogenase